MAVVGLKVAAEMTRKAQVTIHRAMKDGRLSFTIGDTGDRLVDTAELDRVFGIKKPDVISEKKANVISCNDMKVSDLRVLTVEKGFLEDKIRSLEKIIQTLEADKADLISQRNEWQGQAQHFKLLAGIVAQPQPANETHAQPEEGPRRGFWSRLFGG